MSVTVFLVDDHEVVRTGLVSVLGNEPDLEVVGQAASGEEALRTLPDRRPDVVLIDYRLPGMNGIELSREIAEMNLQAAAVVLSAHLDDEVAWACLMAGARGYVVKDASVEELKRAIRAAARGEMYLDPKVATHVVGRVARAPRPSRLDLSPAELRVLRLAADGCSNTMIAGRTGLSPHTVKTQLTSAYRKLGARDRSEATAAAVRKGLI